MIHCRSLSAQRRGKDLLVMSSFFLLSLCQVPGEAAAVKIPGAKQSHHSKASCLPHSHPDKAGLWCWEGNMPLCSLHQSGMPRKSEPGVLIQFKPTCRGLHLDRQTGALWKVTWPQGDTTNFHFRHILRREITKEISWF